MNLRTRLRPYCLVALASTAFIVASVIPATIASASGQTSPGKVWLARYRGAGGYNEAADMAVSPDGSTIFVTGESQSTPGGDNHFDYVTIAYSSATGSQLWMTRYDGPAGGNDYAAAMTVSPDGSKVFVTGSSERWEGGPTDYATIAYDADTGAQLWVARYSRILRSLPWSLAVNPDGSAVYVTGQTLRQRSDWDMATIAYDTGSGAQLWLRRYNGPANLDDMARAVVVSPDGSRVIVTGESRNPPYGSSDAVTIAYGAATGTRLWASRYGDSSGVAIVSSMDGSSVFVAAYPYTLIAYSVADGAKLWTATQPGVSNPSMIATGPFGHTVYVTAEVQTGVSDYDFRTQAYSTSDGHVRWEADYNSPDDSLDAPSSIVAGPDGGSVYVTGASWSSTRTRFTTVAYVATSGARRWVARYNGHHGPATPDGACCVETSQDGSKVFVTGTSFRAAGRNIIATLAYPAA